MESALKTKRATVLAKLVHGGVINADILQQILHETSPNSPVKQAAIRFQYAALKQALLPNYEEFILWLTLKEEEFYTKGKDERAKADVSYESFQQFYVYFDIRFSPSPIISAQ